MFAERRLLVLGMRLDRSTWLSYSSAFNSWKAFIDLHNLDIEPTAESLGDYVMFMSDHIKMSSITAYLSGIVQYLEPYFPNVRTLRNSPLVRDIVIGSKRLRGKPTIRMAPLTTAHVSDVFRSPSHSYNDLLFKTLLVVGFHALLRLGDLCDPARVELRNPAKRARRRSVTITADSIAFELPSHKADVFFEGSTVLVKNVWDGLDAVALLNEYLNARDHLFPFSSPIWLTATGYPPSREWFLSRLRNFNFPKSISGQSMRAGGATALAKIGTPPNIIQGIGRWSSEAWKIYIRKHPLLLHHFIATQAPSTPQHRPLGSSS